MHAERRPRSLRLARGARRDGRFEWSALCSEGPQARRQAAQRHEHNLMTSLRSRFCPSARAGAAARGAPGPAPIPGHGPLCNTERILKGCCFDACCRYNAPAQLQRDHIRTPAQRAYSIAPLSVAAFVSWHAGRSGPHARGARRGHRAVFRDRIAPADSARSDRSCRNIAPSAAPCRR
jgi:hypothetical protein